MKIVRKSPRPGGTTDLSRALAWQDLDTLRERCELVDPLLEGAVVADDVVEHARAARAAHGAAERGLHEASTAQELVAAVRLVAGGRQHLAFVEAYVAGEAPPAERPPCLFDPAHGPSPTDATWTSVRYGTRVVPACLHDAVLLAAGVPPDRRTVEVEGRQMAWWEAGAEALPYLLGYFTGHPLLLWMQDRGNRLPRGVVAPPGFYGEASEFGGTLY